MNATVDTRPIVSSRPLQGFEVLMSQLGDSMGPDLIIGQVQGPMSEALLREACYRVQQRHPTLRAAIRWPHDDRKQRPWLHCFAPDREALDVVVMQDASSWIGGKTHAAYWQWVAEQQAAHRFDLHAGFLFRVVWVPHAVAHEGHLIVCGHHALVDGTSLMRLLQQILEQCQVLQQLSVGVIPIDEVTTRVPVTPLPMPTPLFTHLKFNLLTPLLTWVGKQLMVFEQKQFIHAPWLPVKPSPLTSGQAVSLRTQCVFAQGDAAQWLALQAQCKQQQVTVGGAFSAAVQFALCRYLQQQGHHLPMHNGKVALPLSMDYNMRTRIDRGTITAEALGLCTSIASIGVAVPADITFWDLARTLQHSARQQLKWGIPKIFQRVTDTLLDFKNFCQRQGLQHALSGGVGDGVNISNVGRYPFVTQLSPFALRTVFGFNGACVGGPLMIFWLRHINDTLCYNAVVATPAGERGMLEHIFTDVVELLGQWATLGGHHLTLMQYATHTSTRAPTTVMHTPVLQDVVNF